MMSSEVDSRLPPLSRVLFLSDSGEPMRFFLRPGPTKAQLQPIIRAGGGVVCRVQEPSTILLSDPEDMAEVPANAAHRYVSTQYVRDCVERNQQLEVEDYRFRGESEQTQYTAEEDAAILRYVRGRAQEVRGNCVWQRMEQEVVTSHSWQSMKDRYHKFLVKQQQEPLEEDGGGRERVGVKDGPLDNLFTKPMREKGPAQSVHEKDPPPPSPEKTNANCSPERTDPQLSAEPTHPQPSLERPSPRLTFDRHKIIVLHQQGNSQRAIARLTGFSRCGVQAVIKKFEETGQVEDRKRSGRPKKLSASDERYLKATSLMDRRKSSELLAQRLAESSGTKVHASTVRRSLTRNGLVGRIAAKKPFLRKGKKQKRLQYAEDHKARSDNQPSLKHGGGSVMNIFSMMSSEVDDRLPPLSRVLFLSDSGEPMRFFLRPGPTKAQLQPIIRAGGGVVCRVQEPSTILLSDPEDMAEVPANAAHRYVSTQYVRDCVERNQQLEVEDYRFRGESERTRSAKRKREGSGGRVGYTAEEDAAILRYVRGRAQEVRGNCVWQRMEQEVVTSHSWQSMKDRYHKFLVKQQQEPLEEDGGGRERVGVKVGPLDNLFTKPMREKGPAQSVHEKDPAPPSPEKTNANCSPERTDPQPLAEPTHLQPSPERPGRQHTFDRHKIIVLHQQGNSQRAIARLTGFSRCGVQGVIKKFEETGQVEDKKRSGRPKKLSVSDERYLKVTSLRDRRKSSEVLAQHLAESSGTKVHASTVRRSLTRNGLVGRVAAKKAFLHSKGGRTKY